MKLLKNKIGFSIGRDAVLIAILIFLFILFVIAVTPSFAKSISAGGKELFRNLFFR